MEWARILAYITGTVDQELLLRNEYLAAENGILKAQLKGRLRLSDAERAKLGEIGRRLGRKALGEVATAALPDTILAWYRRLVARKFDGSRARRTPGRPRIDREVEQLIVRMAEENRSWGYDRIVGALANLGHEVSDQTVGNVLRRHGLPPAPERKHTTTWAAFIRAHLAVLAGTDFFTVEVLTLRGLVTYYVLFFIHLESRKVDIAGITVHPDQPWSKEGGKGQSPWWADRPVTLPLGRARFSTSPLPTGSPADANTIGMTDAACFAARTDGVPCVTITSTLSRTNSAAIST